MTIEYNLTKYGKCVDGSWLYQVDLYRKSSNSQNTVRLYVSEDHVKAV